MQRWVEEVEILEEEFRRFVRACDKMRDVWNSLSQGQSSKYSLPHHNWHMETSGFTVYALQKSSMYEKMSETARKIFLEVGGSWPDIDETLCEHVAGRRPATEVDWEADDDSDCDDNEEL